ncbi:MAG: di-trans,poly-cis-decaprenylcistransferase [Clostridia bacterium]|nr:di-trans,poly-cis-decaprenylcistransferase [Clostridia bacterium]
MEISRSDAPIQVDNRLKHIAFIMDGNGRWAAKRGLPRKNGHKAGAKAFTEIVKYCSTIGVQTITVYAFSSENWKRPKDEVKSIFKLLDDYLDNTIKEITNYDVKVRFIGDRSPFDERFLKKMQTLEELSRDHSKTLNIALNYGARPELVTAFNRMLADGVKCASEELISQYLYTADSPDPDLIIRTGGEYRLSNFLLWQAAYSEIYVTDCLWPDMNECEVNKAIENFYQRKRRYGGV